MDKNTHKFYVVDIKTDIIKFCNIFNINTTSVDIKRLPLKDYIDEIKEKTHKYAKDLNVSYSRNGYLNTMNGNRILIHPDHIDESKNGLSKLGIDIKKPKENPLFNLINDNQIPDQKIINIVFDAEQKSDGYTNRNVSKYFIENEELKLISGIDIIEELGNKEEILSALIEEIF